MYYLARLIKKLIPAALKRTVIPRTSKVGGGSRLIDVTFGKYTFCGYDCEMYDTKVGSFCSIANNVKIGLQSHPLTWASSSPAFYAGKDSIPKDIAKLTFSPPTQQTQIGNDVWIGANCCIKRGIRIGNGAVIGMGSIVTHDVGPYEIWAGNPARLIRKRFDDETIL